MYPFFFLTIFFRLFSVNRILLESCFRLNWVWHMFTFLGEERKGRKVGGVGQNIKNRKSSEFSFFPQKMSGLKVHRSFSIFLLSLSFSPSFSLFLLAFWLEAFLAENQASKPRAWAILMTFSCKTFLSSRSPILLSFSPVSLFIL